MAFLAFPRIGWAIKDTCPGVLVSDALPVLVDPSNIIRHLQSLQEISDVSHGGRMAGSHGHNRTIEYIKDELNNLGYYVEVQKFEGLMPINGQATLIVNGNLFDVEPIGWSPSAILTDRPLVRVPGDGCESSHYPEDALGAVVLVSSDGCSFSDKSVAAHQAGADALLIHEPSQLTPSLGGLNDLHVPSARISERTSRSIVGNEFPLWVDLECGDEENTLLVGTHTDSVGKSAGINDNASGVASLLDVAAQLTKFTTKSRVKFAFWTAAEPCLLGSKHFVSTAYPEELERIRLYLDVNMVGSPNGALKVYDGSGESHQEVGPRGSDDAQTTLVNGFDVQGAHSIRTTQISNRSDYAPFLDAHIPFAGLFSGANGLKTPEEAVLFGGTVGHPYDGNYHQREDNIDNINVTTLVLNTKALAHTVGVYGRSFDGFPTASVAWRYATTAKYSTPVTLTWMVYCLVSYAL
ncbi:aminopeptidase Y precursor [Annulohypoxylon bovei var. microspora]|nr:aminopeptidase Y precursor [Annulohypoxylon bovei var. microspora]